MNTSRKSITWAFAFAALAATLSTTASAHHSFSAYVRSEASKRTVHGTIQYFALINPHGTVRVEVPEAGGGTAVWSFELSSAAQLVALGWRRTSLRAGEQVEITYFPLRFGSYGGLLYSVKRPNGQVLFGTSEPDRGYPNPARSTAP